MVESLDAIHSALLRAPPSVGCAGPVSPETGALLALLRGGGGGGRGSGRGGGARHSAVAVLVRCVNDLDEDVAAAACRAALPALAASVAVQVMRAAGWLTYLARQFPGYAGKKR